MAMTPDERFQALYEAHAGAVLSYARRRAARADADDVLAEVFLVAWRRLEEVPRERERVWLLGVARRALANQRRGSTRQGALRERLEVHADMHLRRGPGSRSRRPARRELGHGRSRASARGTASCCCCWPGRASATRRRPGCWRSGPRALRVRLHRARRRLAHALAREGTGDATDRTTALEASVMQTDLLDQISAINPLPEDLPAPPIASLPPLGSRASLTTEPRRPARSRSVLPQARSAGSAGGGGGARPGAARPGRGEPVRRGGRRLQGHDRRQWRPLHVSRRRRGGRHDSLSALEHGRPVPRTRGDQTRTGHTVELVSGGGIESAWATEHAHKILRVHGSAPISKWDPVRTIQDAYRARAPARGGQDGRRRPCRLHHEDPPVARQRGNDCDRRRTHVHAGRDDLSHGRAMAPLLLVIHVLSYEEMPPTPANVTLVGLAQHPGAQVVMLKRSTAHSGR